MVLLNSQVLRSPCWRPLAPLVLGLLACSNDQPTTACAEDARQPDSADVTASNDVTTADATANPCQDSMSCDSFGDCTLDSLGFCRPASDLDCLKSYYCRLLGRCQIVDGFCGVGNLSQCMWTTGCVSNGHCHEVDGWCRATDTFYCEHSVECLTEGYCTARGGGCVRNGEDDATCAADNDCRDFGRCSSVDGLCVAKTDADCQKSFPCVTWGQCSAVDSQCWNTNPADCAKSTGCDSWGDCQSVNGLCQAGSQQDCDQATGLKKGAYVYASGKCRPIVAPPK